MNKPNIAQRVLGVDEKRTFGGRWVHMWRTHSGRHYRELSCRHGCNYFMVVRGSRRDEKIVEVFHI